MLQTKFMLFALVTLMAVGSTVAIVGGLDAVRGRFPFFALIKSYQLKAPYKLHSCGGALIRNDYVLTSAQCLVGSDGAEVFLDIGSLNEKKEIGRESFNVIKRNYHIHPKYDQSHRFVHDLALIKLPSTEAHTEYIRPARFSCVTTPIATNVITMGFGRVSTSFNVFAKTLQYTDMKTTDLHACVADAENLEYEHSVVCARGSNSSICTDDFGGPLVSAKTGKLIGIASHADENCTLGSPQTFTGLLPYIQWIEGIIDDYICKKQVKH